MKLASLLAVILPLMALPLAAAKPQQSGASKLTVNFPGWEKYTDIKDAFSATDRGELAILDDLHRALDYDAGYLVPDGDHLTLTFSDIDLAGDFEPGRGPNWEDVRIVKDIYPPRFAFTYSLTDASGRVLLSGKENIVDLDFNQRLSIDTSDPRHYDKDVLRDWMERKLHGI
jgi:hypothetical protein